MLCLCAFFRETILISRDACPILNMSCPEETKILEAYSRQSPQNIAQCQLKSLVNICRVKEGPHPFSTSATAFRVKALSEGFLDKLSHSTQPIFCLSSFPLLLFPALLTCIPSPSLVSDGGLALSFFVHTLACSVSGGESLNMQASHGLRVYQRWRNMRGGGITKRGCFLDLVNSLEPSSKPFQAPNRQISLKGEPRPRKGFQRVALKCNQQPLYISCRLCPDSTLVPTLCGEKAPLQRLTDL